MEKPGRRKVGRLSDEVPDVRETALLDRWAVGMRTQGSGSRSVCWVGTQCGWSCRADGPGARGEEGPRLSPGLTAGQEDLEESASRRGEGSAAALGGGPDRLCLHQ